MRSWQAVRTLNPAALWGYLLKLLLFAMQAGADVAVLLAALSKQGVITDDQMQL